MMNAHKASLALPLVLFICTAANATGLPVPKAGALVAAAQIKTHSKGGY